MARADLQSRIYAKNKTSEEFMFDSLSIPSMYNYIPQDTIDKLHKLVSSVRYSSKLKYKYQEIDKLMRPLGFRRFHCGTNRIVYSYLEDTRFLVKIALDRVGLKDNPLEYKNQFLLKPFVTKVFEMSKCGTVALVERVEPITSIQEFQSMSNEIYDFLLDKVLGEYVVEDVGCNYFMNWGIRKGFGPVLLDYTYVYKLDGRKLICKKPDIDTGEVCNGVIDYDNGFNNLVCEKCGKTYYAQDLEDTSESSKIEIIRDERMIEMKFSVNRGKDILFVVDSANESKNIINSKKKVNEEFKKRFQIMNDGKVTRGINTQNTEYQEPRARKKVATNYQITDEELQMREDAIERFSREMNEVNIVKDMPSDMESLDYMTARKSKRVASNERIENDPEVKKVYEKQAENYKKTAIVIDEEIEEVDSLVNEIKEEVQEVRQEIKETLSDIKGKITNVVSDLKDEENDDVTIGAMIKDKLFNKEEKVKVNPFEPVEEDVEEVQEELIDVQALEEAQEVETNEEVQEDAEETITETITLEEIVTDTIDEENAYAKDKSERVASNEKIEVIEPITVEEEPTVEQDVVDVDDMTLVVGDNYIDDSMAQLFGDEEPTETPVEEPVEEVKPKQEKKKGKYSNQNYSVDDNKFYSNFAGGKKGNNKKNIFKKY